MGTSRLVILLGVVLLGCSPAVLSGGSVYHGKVVDAETGKPIEGAVVVIVWNKKPAISMDGPQYFHKAVEELTDAEGKFTVDASRGIDWNPGTYVLKEPRFVIFKPGYSPFPRGYGITRITELKEVLAGLHAKERVEVRLLRLRSLTELRRFTSPGSLGSLGDVPFERIPHLIRLLNTQRKSLGLQPYVESSEGGRKP